MTHTASREVRKRDTRSTRIRELLSTLLMHKAGFQPVYCCRDSGVHKVRVPDHCSSVIKQCKKVYEEPVAGLHIDCHDCRGDYH
jgi:hypothetical protein